MSPLPMPDMTPPETSTNLTLQSRRSEELLILGFGCEVHCVDRAVRSGGRRAC